ncbi:Retrovirus-related Pol polyprotein from transposon TNT 1-94 [Cinnamomum micranthum f. kanehirae]|uniref:Retrovirus-related Pol polyprotein from transposon TNT 1-94 n=1 Tax=Cinnamomum micranthum f. kanehirae TaxID=337451 RepID=A0A443PLB1_9MAGN|nr:Retrovirus-related Pol polyprotein from transposon TNT 1-94 [Cinnamomum micranthum f. kanehirae]
MIQQMILQALSTLGISGSGDGEEISFSKVPSFDDECLPSPLRFHPDKVYTRRQGTNATTLPLLQEPIQTPAPASTSTQLAIRRSTRISRPPDRYGFSHSSYFATLSSVSIPTSYSQAAKQECWRQAMKEELSALKQNQTWVTVPCPSSVKPIGSKWVYSIKLKADGTLDRYKARLVALGNRQEYGIDYDETFAPVAKMTTVRTILAIATSQSWPLFQFDVKNAFLHDDLKEEVYMRFPPGFPKPSEDHVALLKRSLYGLKQAPRAWFDKFKDALLKLQFQQSPYDPSLFLHHTSTGITILLVYVDDIIITGTDTATIQDLQISLHQSFHMKDLGLCNIFWIGSSSL